MAKAEKLDSAQKGVIGNFKIKAREFWSLWKGLDDQKLSMSNKSPALQREYKTLMDRGESIRSKISFVTGIIDKASNAYGDVKSWVAEQFGMGEISYRDMQGLGFIPLIPVAVIGVAVASIGYWINDAYKFSAKLSEIQRLERQGITPGDAARIVERGLGNKGLFAGASNMILPIAVGLSVFYWIKNK